MLNRSKPVKALPLFPARPKLPENFAENLLDLETQTAFNLTVPLISSLMQQYSSAIEYYESVHDRKYLYYKDRMHDLLSRKDVIEVLSGPCTKSPQPMMKLSPEPFPGDASRSRLSSRFENFRVKKNPRPVTDQFHGTLQVPKLNPDVAITEHLQESSTVSNLARESIRKQEGDNLQERLQARRRASSLKPQKKSQITSPRESKLEQFQKEIEEIMEKYAEDKIHKIQAIKSKYSEKPDQEIEEKAKKMQQEIDQAQELILKERKEKIELLRTKYEGK